jgi:uncharacterized membrane protein
MTGVQSAALPGLAWLLVTPVVGAASAAPESISRAVDWVATGVEVAGIAIIVLGAMLATAVFLHRWLQRGMFPAAYRQYRGYLGRAILLGLEFLVAADIIGTVAVDPTFRSLGVLGLIVLIRTFLSFALEVEIQGRWPWQAHEPSEEAREGHASS